MNVCNHCSFEKCERLAKERNAVAFAYRGTGDVHCRLCSRSEFKNLLPHFDWGVYAQCDNL